MSCFALWPSDMYPANDLKLFIFAVSILLYYVQFSHPRRKADRGSVLDNLKNVPLIRV